MLGRRLAVLGGLALAGCQVYRPANGAPTPGGDLRVRYEPPSDVHAIAGGGVTLLLPGVRQLEGRVVSIRADTIVLTVMRTSPAYRVARPPAAPTVAVVRGSGTRVETLRFDPARPVKAGLRVSAAAASIFVVGFLLAAAAFE